MTHDVFISHSSKDKLVADAACAALEAAGIRCWIAPRDITPGTEWGEAIIDAMETSRVMILVFSEHANQSTQIIREVERAVNKGVFILPFRIEDVKMSKSMEYFISATHWLDALSRPVERHLQYLVDTVQRLITQPSLDPGSLGEVLKAGLRDAPPGAESVAAQGPTQPLMVWPPEVVQLAEKRLAEYVGPLARILVRKTLPKVTTVNELYGQLAQTIPTEPERKEFLKKSLM